VIGSQPPLTLSINRRLCLSSLMIWRPSGERLEGFANFYAMLTHYPSRDGIPPSNDHKHVNSKASAALTPVAPTYTIVSVDGAGNLGTFTVRGSCPVA